MSSVSAEPEPIEANTPRSASMGGAGVGGAISNTALTINPAGMSSGSFYAVDGYYYRTSSEENHLGISVADSQTRYARDQLALGLAYQAVIQGGEAKAHDARLGLSFPLFNIAEAPILGGLSGRYIYDERTERDGFDIDIGLMTQIAEMVSIGLVGRELLEERLRFLGGGLGLNTARFTLHLDYLRRAFDQRSELRSGAELMIGDRAVLRGGYRHAFLVKDDKDREVSGGLAIIGLGGGNGQLSFSYTHYLDRSFSFFGVSLSAYLQMNDEMSNF